MAHLVNIRIYDHNWDIEWSLPLSISIYNVTDSVSEVTWDSMTWSIPLQRYQYSFVDFDPNKEYVCDIDCSSGAIIRYLSCWFWDQNAGWSIWNYSNKPLILNLNDRISKIL